MSQDKKDWLIESGRKWTKDFLTYFAFGNLQYMRPFKDLAPGSSSSPAPTVSAASPVPEMVYNPYDSKTSHPSVEQFVSCPIQHK